MTQWKRAGASSCLQFPEEQPGMTEPVYTLGTVREDCTVHRVLHRALT